MKINTMMVALLLALAVPSLAWSQNAPSPSPSGGPPAGGGWGNHGPGGPEDASNFQERKAEILRRIDEHIAEAVNRKKCVEAANDHQALRACMPQMGGEGRGGMQGGRGGPPPGGQPGGPGGGQNEMQGGGMP